MAVEVDIRGTVTILAGGRHHVEAPDLTPWYAADQADPDTLAPARTGFGDMILTPETIATHNPWHD